MTIRPHQGRKRRLAPFWLRPPATDHKHAHAEVAAFIESPAEAEDRREADRERMLKSAKTRALAPRHGSCLSLEDACAKPHCAFCARQFRLWAGTANLQFLREREVRNEIVVATLILRSLEIGELHSLDLPGETDSIRRILKRLGEPGLFAIGGIEVALRDDAWALHAHVLMPRLSAGTERQLREVLRRRSGDRAVKMQPVCDALEQTTYLLKFPTGHRPGKQRGRHPARMIPLPDPAFSELVQFWAKHTVEDFFFAFGVRREGTSLRSLEHRLDER